MSWTDLQNDVTNFQGALSDIGKQRQTQANEMMVSQRKFQQELELMKAKAQVESEIKSMDPIAQFLKQAEIADAINKMENAGMDTSKYKGMFGPEPQQSPSEMSETYMPQGQSFQPQSFEQANPNLVATEYKRGAFGKMMPGKFTDVNAVTNIERKKELAKGVPTAESGKIALARESLRNIEAIKKTLFPSGKAKSFQRGKAFASNLPLSYVPGLPQRAPFNKDAQDIYRQMGSALSGRQLIQTGVAARPEETAKLVAQYAPNLFSADEAAMQGLSELQDFYKTYIYIVETKGLQSADEWAASQNTPGNVIGAEGKTQQSNMPTPEQINEARKQGYTGWDTEKGQFVR